MQTQLPFSWLRLKLKRVFFTQLQVWWETFRALNVEKTHHCVHLLVDVEKTLSNQRPLHNCFWKRSYSSAFAWCKNKKKRRKTGTPLTRIYPKAHFFRILCVHKCSNSLSFFHFVSYELVVTLPEYICRSLELQSFVAICSFCSFLLVHLCSHWVTI